MEPFPKAATQQDIQNSERLLDLSNQLIDSINERKKLLKGINAEEQQYFVTVKQQQKLSQDIAANAEKYLGYQIKSKDLAKQIKATKDNQGKTELAFNAKVNGQASLAEKLEKQRQEALQKAFNIRKQVKQQTDLINKLDEKNQDLQILKNQAEREGNTNLAKNIQTQIRENQRIANNKEKYVKTLETQFDKEKNLAKTARETIENGKKLLEDQKKELAFLEKNLEIRKRIEKSTGLLGGMAKAASKIPGIGQYLNADEAIDEMEKLAASIEESGGKATSFGNRMKIAGKGLQVLAKGAYDNLKSPEAVFTFFLKAALTANTEAVKLGKSLGYGNDRANAFRENLVGIESASANINVTTANLVEAYGELAIATGLAYEFTEDQLVTQIKLTKQVGLTADEAAQVQRFAVLNNKTSEETYKSFLKGITASRNQLKVGIDFKATLAEAVKVSGQLAAQLGNNPELIGKAIVTAKALGMTLEQVAKAGSTLLDFGTSISSELEAELLTGKELNLERARAAALAGDQITLAEELAKNMGTAADFTKLNKLQQDSLAKSIGMSSDELAETLKKREEAIASGKSLAQITEEEAAQALERQSIQDKFGQSILKLQSLIGNLLSGPLGTMLDILVQILNVANLILQPFTLLANFIKESTAASLTFLGVLGAIYAIKNRTFLVDKATVAIAGVKRIYAATEIGQLGIIQSIKSRGFFKTLAEAAMTAFKSVASIPFVGPVLGAAAADTAVGLGMKLFSKGDDVISPGYGKRVLSTPEGSISLNNKDTIVAGTDLGGKPADTTLGSKPSESLNKGKSEMVVPQIDLTPMIMAINEVRSAVDRLYSKDQSINMDGKKVGTTLVQGSYKVA
jgi:hypothetical protein